MTVLGATTNSAVGFLLPIIFYLKTEKNTSMFTKTKVAAYLLFAFICVSSVVTLTLFVRDFINEIWISKVFSF